MKWIESCTGKRAVYESSPSASNHSPYGIQSDCFLSVKKAKDLGYEFPLANEWLPKLLVSLIEGFAVDEDQLR